LAVRVESIRDFHLLHQEGVETLILPVSRGNLHQLQSFAGKLRGRQEKIIWHLPFIIFEADLPFYREAVDLLIQHGFSRFEAANLSHFALLQGCAVDICCDYRLYSLFSQALLHWQERGATAATLYLEDDFPNMEILLRANLQIEPAAPRPGSGDHLRCHQGVQRFPLVSAGARLYVTSRDGLTTVTADRRFAISGYRRKLRDSGCASFIADLSGETGETRKRVLDACIRGTAIEGASEFNFTTELL
jgi:putative protease